MNPRARKPNGRANQRLLALVGVALLGLAILAIVFLRGYLRPSSHGQRPPRSATAPPGTTRSKSSAPTTGSSVLARRALAMADEQAAGAGARLFPLRVVWADSGEGVAATSVTAILYENGEQTIGDTVCADAAGSAAVSLPAGARVVALEPHHPFVAFVSQQVITPPATSALIRVQRGSAVFGRVVYEDGRPAAGARVRLPDGHEDRRPEATAAGDGVYELVGVGGAYAHIAASLGPFISEIDDDRPAFIKLAPGQRCGPHDLVLHRGLNLTGVVRSQETGKPIPGARVAVDERDPVTADAHGAYRAEGLPIKRIQLGAYTPDYADRQVLFQMIGGAAANTCDLALEPGGVVHVLVTDEKLAPIENARIGVKSGAASLAKRHKGLRTDAKGEAEVEGVSLSERFYITASARDYSRDKAPVFAPGARTANLVFVMEPFERPVERDTENPKERIAFAGRVTDASGAPIAGATVAWGHLRQPTGAREVKTDDAGEYRWEDSIDAAILTENVFRSHVLLATAKGYAPAWELGPKPGTPDHPRVVDFTLEQGHWIAGAVVDGRGDPVPGVQVIVALNPKNPQSNMFPVLKSCADVRTDGQGRFRIDDLPQTAISVTLKAKGWTDTKKDDMALDQETRIVMKDGGVIRGRVVEEESEAPVTAFTVKLAAVGGGVYKLEREELRFNSPEGRFTCYDLEWNRSYKVTVTADGFVPCAAKTMRADSQDQSTDIIFKASKGLPLAGTVLDAATKAPIQGAGISYNLSGAIQRVVTDKDGAFAFQEGTERGVIAVEASGYAGLTIQPDERSKYGTERSLRIELKRGGVIQGTVTHGGAPATLVEARAHLVDRGGEGSGDFESRDAILGANGGFRIGNLPAGNYILEVKGHDMPFDLLSKRPVVLAEGEEKTVDVECPIGEAVLSGRVLLDQAPFPEAVVVLRNFSDQDSLKAQVQTDSDGAYRIEKLPEGEYRVSATCAALSGERIGREDDFMVRGQTQHDFLLFQKHKVTATIVFDFESQDAEAPRVQSAILSLDRDAAAQEEAGAAAGGEIDDTAGCSQASDNELSFTGRFKGLYDLFLSCEIGQNRTRRIRVPDPVLLDNLAADQDLGEIRVSALPDGGLAGQVFDVSGTPIAGARVSLNSTDEEEGHVADAASDSDGYYEIPWLEAGEYLATVRKDIPLNDGRTRTASLTETVRVDGPTAHDFILLNMGKVVARFVLSPRNSDVSLADFASARIVSVDAAPQAQGRTPDPLQLDRECSSNIQDGQVVFDGRFLGEYVLSVEYKGPMNTWVRIPGTRSLDNVEADQDLGVIIIPPLGFVRVLTRIEQPIDTSRQGLGDGVIAAAPLRPAPEEAGGPSPAQLDGMTFDLKEDDQIVGPFAQGAYRLTVLTLTHKSDPAAADVIVTARQMPTVSFVLRPQGILLGRMELDGAREGDIPDRVILAGPDGVRTLIPDRSLDFEHMNLVDLQQMSDGEWFIFLDLPSGVYQLRIEADGYQPYVGEHVIKAGDPRSDPLEIHLKRQ